MTAHTPPHGTRGSARTGGATAAIVGVGLLAFVSLIAGTVVLLTSDSERGISDGPTPVVTPTPVTATAPVDGQPGRATYGTGRCAPEQRPSRPRRSFTDAPRRCIDQRATYEAVVATDHGSFTITLDPARAPVNVNNFVNLARWGYYDDVTCHRVIEDLLVQCGRPGDDELAPGYTVPDELPAPNDYEPGVVAMANRAGVPDSAGGQWFIVTGDDGADLAPAYTIIGRVTDGYRGTVQDLAGLADPTADNGEPPVEPIRIESITIVES